MPLRDDRGVVRWRWKLLSVWIVIFTIAVAFSLRQLREQNNEIQRSRVEACQRTYQLFQTIIQASVKDRTLTPEENKRLVQFLKLTNPSHCETVITGGVNP